VAQTGKPDSTEIAFFESKIRPVLIENCYRCHSDEALKNKKLKAGLRLDSRDALLKGGESGPALVPAEPAKSLLLRALRHEGGLEMPPGKKLDAAVIADFENWIRAGAPDPRKDGESVAGADEAAKRQHWAFQRLKAPTPPPAAQKTNPIDAFLQAALRAKGLTAGAPAPRRVLVRRLYFDLIGLPPTPEEMAAAVAMPAGDWPAKLIEDLLSSPHHGERWGQHWLDVARYADSSGYSVDSPRPTMYQYRDFVIRALNDDMPFDRFLRWQLAGDLVAPPDPAAVIATGFCTCGPYNTNSPKEQDRYDELDDIMTTAAQAFLGLNLGCARCHDHKYDPITQKEYYRLLAVFNGSQRGDRPIVPGTKNMAHVLNDNRSPGESFFLRRGNPANKGDRLTAGFFDVLVRHPEREKHWLKGVLPRQALADWLVDVEHGAGSLTARVIVNRLWQNHFGEGLVRTPNDFGLSGEAPTHPELLDWLANKLIAEGWCLRPIHRLILTSAAYQQSSAFDPRQAKIDPDNRFLWRQRSRRLEAEGIRDAILAVGELDRKLYGPAVFPYIPPEAALSATRSPWQNTEKDSPDTWRRSIYVFAKRSVQLPILQAFDRPDGNGSAGRRHRTTIVPQALHLLNDPLIRTQCERFAERVQKMAGAKREAQIKLAFETALGRPPTPVENEQALRFLEKGAADGGVVTVQILADLCQALVMTNEFIYVE
jgi:hypothetical protein